MYSWRLNKETPDRHDWGKEVNKHVDNDDRTPKGGQT